MEVRSSLRDAMSTMGPSPSSNSAVYIANWPVPECPLDGTGSAGERRGAGLRSGWRIRDDDGWELQGPSVSHRALAARGKFWTVKTHGPKIPGAPRLGGVWAEPDCGALG